MTSALDLAGTVFVAEEALFGRDLTRLAAWVERQPTWSDLPFIVLTGRHNQVQVTAWRQQLIASLRNVTLLERPMQAVTLTTTVQAAVRARMRQYQVGTLLDAQDQAAQALEAQVIARTEELANTNSELRRQMAERARVEAALRQVQKMEAIGQLSGGIAHDFNNLLQGVAGSLDLIRKHPGNAERVRRWAEAGLMAAERGARLTGQLLAFSRAQRIETKAVDVSKLVLAMQDLLVRTLGPMIKISLKLGTDGLAVLSDPTQLEMALLNLAINARDAMPQGGELAIVTGLKTITDDPGLEPGDYLELTVSDTGSGMSAEVAAQAFNPFYTTKGVGKGTGLGLSQVYGIARQAGGVAQIESRPGEGTTIRLLLRVTGQPVAPDDASEPDGPGAEPDAATVLVIDDDAQVRRFLTDSLDTLGYKVAEAEDGDAGLRALETSVPDVMVLDFAMPGLTGAEVAKAAWARLPGLPIVFASGFADTAAVEEVAGASMSVLRKPFRIDELKVAVAEALRKARADTGRR